MPPANFISFMSLANAQLCDFGLARSAKPPPNVANDSSTFMTEYVATRYVYAPCIPPRMLTRMQVVSCPRSHVNVQRVHPRNRRLERWMRARRDALGETAVSWTRLYFISLRPSSVILMFRQIIINYRSSSTSLEHHPWTISMQ